MLDEKLLIEILDSRERRANKQKELADQYGRAIISFTLNTPGREKTNELYKRIHREGLREIWQLVGRKELAILYEEVREKVTGPEAFLVIDLDPVELKSITIELEENHPLGRIFDIDVIGKDGRQIGRSDIGAGPRTCLLCKKEVRLCMREKNHTYEELISKIKELGEKYL